MDFSPSSTVERLQSRVDEFVERELEPLEDEFSHFLGADNVQNRLDSDGTLCEEFLSLRTRIRKKSAEAGLLTMHMPDPDDEAVDLLDYLQVEQYVHNRHPDGFHGLILETPLTPRFSLLEDSESLRETYYEPMLSGEKTVSMAITEPEHGSDITHMDATASRDGDSWVIDGTKSWIANSTFADAIIVFARTSGVAGDARGISAFVVDRDNPGWEVGDVQRSLGDLHAGRLAVNHFDNCSVSDRRLVGEEGTGFVRFLLPCLDYYRLRLPARVVGRCEWLFQQCVEHAETRTTSGRSLGTRQFVQGMIADMRVDIETVKWLYRYAAWIREQDARNEWVSSAASLRGAELWNAVADTTVQLHGADGCSPSLPFESEYRNARDARVYEGTDEMQRRTIARSILDLD